jgi:hypothetical protein
MNSIYLGMMNALTLLKPGKLQEMAEQIVNTQLEIVAILETRWTGNGLIKINNYSLYYSGCNKTGQAGTGFIYIHEECNYILGFEPHSERICK